MRPIEKRINKSLAESKKGLFSRHTFKEWLNLEDNNLLLEEDLLNTVINVLKKYSNEPSAGNLNTVSSVVYDYLTSHNDRRDLVKNLLQTDMTTYNTYNAKYKQLIEMVADKISKIGYTFFNNGAWAQYSRSGPGGAKKDDGMTTKRYVSLEMKDIWIAFQKLPALGQALNQVNLRPEANQLSFKVPGNYGAALQHKDTIVIHFYDKTAGPQVDNAVQAFLNAAGIKESDRSSLGRSTFGKDSGGTSDSDTVAHMVAKYFNINKNKLPQFLSMPNFKEELKRLIDKISMTSSHRAGVRHDLD